jgi:hypothetical protein
MDMHLGVGAGSEKFSLSVAGGGFADFFVELIPSEIPPSTSYCGLLVNGWQVRFSFSLISSHLLTFECSEKALKARVSDDSWCSDRLFSMAGPDSLLDAGRIRRWQGAQSNLSDV